MPPIHMPELSAQRDRDNINPPAQLLRLFFDLLLLLSSLFFEGPKSKSKSKSLLLLPYPFFLFLYVPSAEQEQEQGAAVDKERTSNN